MQSTEGVKKMDKLIHRAPDAPCFGHLISMTCRRRMIKGQAGLNLNCKFKTEGKYFNFKNKTKQKTNEQKENQNKHRKLKQASKQTKKTIK